MMIKTGKFVLARSLFSLQNKQLIKSSPVLTNYILRTFYYPDANIPNRNHLNQEVCHYFFNIVMHDYSPISFAKELLDVLVID